jgi:hypothetical protein
MRKRATCSFLCFLARSDAVNCHWDDRELKAQGTDVIIVADMLPLMLPLRKFFEQVFKPAKISNRGFDNFTLHLISVEIFESFAR